MVGVADEKCPWVEGDPSGCGIGGEIGLQLCGYGDGNGVGGEVEDGEDGVGGGYTGEGEYASVGKVDGCEGCSMVGRGE